MVGTARGEVAFNTIVQTKSAKDELPETLQQQKNSA